MSTVEIEMNESSSPTSELLYILQHKRFQTSLADYGVLVEFLIPLLAIGMAIFLILGQGGLFNYVVGLVLIAAAIFLSVHMITRFRQLNRFEEFNRKATAEENENYCIDILRKINVEQLDWDPDDYSISAKFKSSGLPRYEWLTIVFNGEKILINARPSPVSLITWWRRNALQDFVKHLSN